MLFDNLVMAETSKHKNRKNQTLKISLYSGQQSAQFLHLRFKKQIFCWEYVKSQTCRVIKYGTTENTKLSKNLNIILL